MASLGELRASLFPSAVEVAPLTDAARDREVGWVRVLKARVPAFDGLDPGDLAIVPGRALEAVAAGPREAVALVTEFVRAGIAGLLLVDGDPDAGSPALDRLGLAAADADLPALRVARLDPDALERSAIGFLVNRRAELDRQAALLEAQLEGIALEGGELADLVGAIGVALGRAVALESGRGDALTIHAPADVAGAAAAVKTYMARPRAVALRVALPAAPPSSSAARPGRGRTPAPDGVGVLGRAPAPDGVGVLGPPPTIARRGSARRSGSLALLGERPPSELERVVAERIAVLLALELARDDSIRRAHDATRPGHALPADGPPWAVLLADQSPPNGALSIEQREELRRELRVLGPARQMTLRGDAASLELRIVLAAPGDDPGGLGLAQRIGRFLGRVVALSRPFSDPADRPAAEAEARATLEAVRSAGGPGGVVRADRLAAYRLLGGLHNLPDGPRQARALLEPLLGQRVDVRTERVATLRAILDHPGLGDAAAALGVHRNTVAYRVRRMEAATGWSLSDPDLRMALAVALRIVQSAQD
ncbi:MAG: PucR family transcriptional regulator, purine catabolism regulatory protein [Chloroflexota bacterium]|jgi:hypothetical protein|nr:PucR family transcriptional regulator, purine catabolism regulatory protein [Chloroflexota bacterium]